MSNNIIQFFLNEYVEEKKIERACNKLDMLDMFYMAYTGAQPTERHKVNRCFDNLKKERESLLREIVDNYDEIKQKQVLEKGKETWGNLRKEKKKKRKVMF
jgi:hypothetical protein